ncbi:MAG: hypothetical protein U1F35_17040 [Steroidobacteraceae bacterium]
MKRTAVACMIGFMTWVVIATLLNLVVRAAITDYSAAERTLDFTLQMQLARLALAALASIGAGWITTLVSVRGSRAALVCGTIVMAFMLPVHVKLWDKFPLWYHGFFLLTIVPFFWLGSALAAALGSRSATQ